MKWTSFIVAAMTFSACATYQLAPRGEDIRLPQYDSGGYIVSIRLEATGLFPDPRHAVYNYLGKDIDGDPITLRISEAASGQEAGTVIIRSVTSEMKADPRFGHTFDNASVLELDWSDDHRTVILKETYYRSYPVERILVLEDGRFVERRRAQQSPQRDK